MIPAHLKPNAAGLVPVMLLARYLDGCRQLPEGYIAGLAEQRAIEAVQQGRARWPTATEMTDATADKVAASIAPEKHPAPIEPPAASPATPADFVEPATLPPSVPPADVRVPVAAEPMLHPADAAAVDAAAKVAAAEPTPGFFGKLGAALGISSERAVEPPPVVDAPAAPPGSATVKPTTTPKAGKKQSR